MQVYKHSFAGVETELDRRVEPVTSALIREQLIGVSAWADRARAAVAAHAAHDNTVVLEGAPGAGKKFLARLIHDSSARFEQPFVAFSCREVSSESVEAALFGSLRAAGLVQTGLIQALGAGTLYINGVTSFTPSLKAKVARLIEYREFCPAGSDSVRYADVRVIIGSSEPTVAAFERSDSESLRRAVIDRLVIPRLYHRPADVEPLSSHFAAEFCRQLNKERREIADEVIAVLTRYDWPGNVSELKRVIFKMIERSKPAALDASLLPAHLSRAPVAPRAIPVSGIDLTGEVEQFEIALLSEALRQCRGVQNKAAQLLGIKPTTLNMKLMRFGINVSQFK
ncbi:MAG TPA: sigma 54-interacting transcriptional regulator [Blastocatellia bacterium]|nr:sigma 54-interacting transcriptional regulator [Blastocatellia bacterium]